MMKRVGSGMGTAVPHGAVANAFGRAFSTRNQHEKGTNLAKSTSLNFGVTGAKIDSRPVSTLETNLVKMMASVDFISNALSRSRDSLISYMNSWDDKTMGIFIDSFDAMPEAMLAKLFSAGLDVTHIPVDIALSQLFLRVAVNENPKRLAQEILNKNDVGQVRYALKDFQPTTIKKLVDNGLSLNDLPVSKTKEVCALMSPDEIKRFSGAFSRPINVMQKLALSRSLGLRSASSSTP